MSEQIIIVGAGPGGLATAMRLASKGYSVQIFEATDRVGGRMRGFVDGDYAFDTGPTILQLPRVYEELFAEAGLRLADYIQFKQLNPNTRIRFWDDSQLDLTSDLDAFKAQLTAMRSDLPEAFDRWYTEHIRKNEAGYKPYLGSPVRSPLGYLRPNEIATGLSFRPWETLYQHFWRFFQDDRLVYALSYPSKYLGMHPTACSSIFSLIPFLEFADGVWHPEGGFRALAQALAHAAKDLGVKIHLNCPIKQVWIESDRTRGVELVSGERISADAVVVNADFGYGVRHLLPESARGRYTDEKLSSMQFSCSTFMLYLGINRRYELPHHQLYLSEHIRKRERPWVDDSALDETDPPFYVCNPSIVDPSNAPAGHSTLYVLVPIPNTSYGVDWQSKQQVYRDLVIQRMSILGFADVEKHIVTETCYTADTWRDDYYVHLGAVFNLGHGWRQLGPFRPPIRSENVRNLYWIGGAVHPGSGLLTILEAARSATFFVNQDLGARAAV
ncbi:phytoene desaturase family protein [Gloeocapsopsis dulcis]|uniref:Phytoene dehydrogenase n=1 Tax=Gloeocapsopsis dulcis AAB1 = 1H9 TaxID=1433147 RepID=A0A6N8FSL1_9CHRO|nr:phytoene desaturase family protein [Gloeocapsopsis dulcis]MUL35744.1 phytoene dehydrogenase [Gloeocapsopsis dulcis AAB1 = 1H9]WNN90971.1 phytoene desaturase family protein [Gloeocapsopsis dulcis]